MKIKKILLSFVLMLSMLLAVACKDKSDPAPSETSPATKSDPTISVSIEDRVYVVGESLADIELIVASGGTSGSVSWDNEDYVLVEGTNVCSWTFTPTDTSTYNSMTKNVSIDAIKLEVPQVVVSVPEGQTVYIDARHETITLQASASFGGEVVEGDIFWNTPNETFVEGENVCEWKFVPTQSTTYAVVRGTVKLTADTEQEIQTVVFGSNTKTDYVAFDKFDVSGLTLLAMYNAGKVEELTNLQGQVQVVYNDTQVNKLRRRDTSVTIAYKQYSIVVEGLNVDYKEVEVPVFDKVVIYDGNTKTLDLSETSGLYSYEPLSVTNAGEYELELTLENSEDYKWANGDLVSTSIICTVQKAQLDVQVIDYYGEYDGLAHSATISLETQNTIYYSDTELDESNYTSASTENITKTNAGEYEVFYYIEGDDNHYSKAGTVYIDILKQTPTMSLQYCYTLKTGSVVNYPIDYVSIIDKQNNAVNRDGLVLTYYSSYVEDEDSTNDIKTTTSDGAITLGGAPKNDKTTEYYVVVEFQGTQNYNSVIEVTCLYIDGTELEFYANSSEDGFAFRDEILTREHTSGDTTTSVTGSNSECNAYLEFNELEVDENGLKIVEFSSKFSAGAESIETGRLVYANGTYQLLSGNGTLRAFTYDSTNKEITMSDSTILKKWEFPKYLKTFSAQTVSDDDYNAEKNNGKNTEITFYNDYGTIRFNAKVNVKYIQTVVGSSTEPYVEWAGVAEIAVSKVGSIWYFVLDCYVINVNSLECSGYSKTTDGFKVYWSTAKTEPNSVTLYAENGSLLTGYEDLLDKTYTEV